MDFYFFDSSAAVKNYLNETGTNWVKSIFSTIPQAEIFMASITEVEVVRLKVDFNSSTFTFVSADNELNSAAQAENLTVENPNNYP